MIHKMVSMRHSIKKYGAGHSKLRNVCNNSRTERTVDVFRRRRLQLNNRKNDFSRKSLQRLEIWMKPAAAELVNLWVNLRSPFVFFYIFGLVTSCFISVIPVCFSLCFPLTLCLFVCVSLLFPHPAFPSCLTSCLRPVFPC